MRTHNGGGGINHNVQTAVESKNHFVVAVDVTSETVDHAQLYNIASQVKEELQVGELIAIADKGYYSGEQFSKCKDESISLIAPHPDKGGGQERGYKKGYFSYDKEIDAYRCPQGQVLTQPAQKRTTRKGDRYYNPTACANHCFGDKTKAGSELSVLKKWPLATSLKSGLCIFSLKPI